MSRFVILSSGCHWYTAGKSGGNCHSPFTAFVSSLNEENGVWRVAVYDTRRRRDFLNTFFPYFLHNSSREEIRHSFVR